MLQQLTRIVSVVSLILGILASASAQGNLSAKSGGLSGGSAPAAESDRSRDGLAGPVRRIRTEVVKLSTVGGKTTEDNKRVLLETAEYDIKGTKTQNQYFPIAGATLTGREVYKYDEKGNISEMTLVNADGSLISKEVYKYDFDSVGNWTKMTTSIAVVGNGKIDFEPTEATYRTIFYYLDAKMAAMMQPSNTSSSAPAPAPAPTGVAAKTDSPGQPERSVLRSQPTLNSSAPRVEAENKMAAQPPSTVTSLDRSKVGGGQSAMANVSALPEAPKNVEVSTDSSAPPPRPLLKPVSGGVLNGKAITLPTPVYPDVARRMRTSGQVEVEVVVDEDGKVVSARAISGPQVLREVAVQAALRARFTPTKLSGQPVKISGRINYNFNLPQ